MYVYEPGSGFKGEAKLVTQGFEWSDISCSKASEVQFDLITQTSQVKIEDKLQPSAIEDFSPTPRYVKLLFSSVFK